MVHPAPRVRGRVRPPGDKSISHRYAPAGRHRRRRLDDPRLLHRRRLRLHASLPARPRRRESTKSAGIRRSGIEHPDRGPRPPRAASRPPRRSTPAIPAARCGCSPGSSPRTRSATSITGDDSLQRRPMRRIIVPLERMGARDRLLRRPAAADHRGHPRAGGHRLRARGAQRAGQERGAAGRSPRGRRHAGPRAAAHAGSYGARAGRVRRAGRRVSGQRRRPSRAASA